MANWRTSNPDIIELSQVTGCDVEVRESRTEIKRTNAQGEEVSYNPPRYDIDYDIYIKVYVSHPYFSEVSWKVNRSRIETKNSSEYRDVEQRAEAVRAALSGIHRSVRAAAAPKTAVTCPNCLATTKPDANGCCEYCGSSLQAVMANDAAGTAAAQPFAQGYDQQQTPQRASRQGYGQQYEDYGEQDYGEQDYGEQDYGEGYGQQGYGRQQTGTQRPGASRIGQTQQGRPMGQAKADFRRQQNR